MSKYEFKRSLAVVIGINNYSNDIHPLETAKPDAEELARILTPLAGSPDAPLRESAGLPARGVKIRASSSASGLAVSKG